MSLFVPLLPGARSTMLLRAALLRRREAADAWRSWCDGRVDLRKGLAHDARPLLPLLYESVKRNALDVGPVVLTYLRSAYVTEALRGAAYDRVLTELARLLGGTRCAVVKGAALRVLCYADPVLRHAHDIELLVPDALAVRNTLDGESFRKSPDGVIHVSGLPVRLHERLPIPVTATLEFRDGLITLDATDSLALTLVHASRSIARSSMQWVCDAVALMRSSAIDQERFDAAVQVCGSGQKVRRQLDWLASNFDASFPVR